MKLALAALILAGCATPKIPYTVEYPIGDWSPDWNGDGNPKTLEVNNPLPYPVHVDVLCISENEMPWETDVPAKGQVRVLIQVLNRDQFVNDCSVTGWKRLEHAKHGMRRR